MIIQSGIYKITNIINNKFYIGSAINFYHREKVHFSYLKKNNHPNQHLQNAYNFYGKGKLFFEIIEYIEPNKEKLIEREQYYIDLLKPEYNILKNAYNNLGYKHTDETRKKMSKSSKGKLKSKKHSQNISNGLKGKPKSEIHKLHLKKSDEWKKKRSESMIGEKNANYGKKLSEEQKKKISETCKKRYAEGKMPQIGGMNKGKQHSEIHKKRLSEANKGKHSKSILQFDLKNNFIKKWLSIKEAKETLKIFGIDKVLAGKYKQSGGFIWRYENINL